MTPLADLAALAVIALAVGLVLGCPFSGRITMLSEAKKKKPVPVMRDLLTGEIGPMVRKSGDGSHIRMTPSNVKGTPIPGMFYFAGTGPKRRQCRECAHCGEGPPTHKNGKPTQNACVLMLQTMKRASFARDIGVNAACKYFDEASEPERKRAIRWTGRDWIIGT